MIEAAGDLALGEPVSEDAPTLVIVDDDQPFRQRLCQAFQRRGYAVLGFASGQGAVASCRQRSPELAIVDLRLGGKWGLQVVRELLDIDPCTRVVVLTAYGSIATAIEAVKMGATNYLQKPASVDEIINAFQDTEGDGSQTNAPPEVPSLAKAEWEHINRVLTECGGNVRQTARLLGLHRRTLQRKLAKFPVQK